MIRVVGGATPSNNVFFVKRIIKIPLPLRLLITVAEKLRKINGTYTNGRAGQRR